MTMRLRLLHVPQVSVWENDPTRGNGVAAHLEIRRDGYLEQNPHRSLEIVLRHQILFEEREEREAQIGGTVTMCVVFEGENKAKASARVCQARWDQPAKWTGTR